MRKHALVIICISLCARAKSRKEYMELIDAYIEKRQKELKDMLAIYDEAGQEPPIDLLARHQELERLSARLNDYREVNE